MTNIPGLCGYKPQGSSENPAGSGSNPCCLSARVEVATCETSMINTWGTNPEWLTERCNQITPPTLIYSSDLKDQSLIFSQCRYRSIIHSDTACQLYSAGWRSDFLSIISNDWHIFSHLKLLERVCVVCLITYLTWTLPLHKGYSLHDWFYYDHVQFDIPQGAI